MGTKSDAGVGYDDASFYLFAMAMLSLVTVPWTIVKIWKLVKGRDQEEKENLRQRCGCRKCQEKAQTIAKQKKKSYNTWARPSNIFVFVSWILIFLLLREIRKSPSFKAPFDPFEILEISKSASDKEIKGAYRRLSKLTHPDRNPNNPEAAERFMQVTKAHQALTDPVGKENYQKYGNPDGPIRSSINLALPSVMEDHGNLLLMIYLGSLIVVLPAFVVLWWRSNSDKLATSISVNTYLYFRVVLHASSRWRDLLAAFASAFEFEHMAVNNPRKFAHLRDVVRRSGAEADLKQIRLYMDVKPYLSENILILLAYTYRLGIDEEFQSRLDDLLGWTEGLVVAMTDANREEPRQDCFKTYGRTVFGRTRKIMSAIFLGQCLAQAMKEKDSSLLQIPGFRETELKYCNSKSHKVRNVHDFVALDIDARRKILRNFSSDEFLDVNEFCLHFPTATLNVAAPRVDDEIDSSVHEIDKADVEVTLTVKRGAVSDRRPVLVFAPCFFFLHLYLQTEFHAKRSSSLIPLQGAGQFPCVPNLPDEKQEVWWVILDDKKHDVPLAIKRLKPKDFDAEGSATFKLDFIAGIRGKYEYVVHALCDCYVGADVYSTIKFTVEPKLENTDSLKYFDTDDESDYEEYNAEVEDGDEEEETNSDGNEDGNEDGKAIGGGPAWALQQKSSGKEGIDELSSAEEEEEEEEEEEDDDDDDDDEDQVDERENGRGPSGNVSQTTSAVTEDI